MAVGIAVVAVPTASALLDALPQTQCTRCGFADCRGYAEAMAAGSAEINRCPPGGAEGVARLAQLVGRLPLPLDPSCGAEAPRQLARIDESRCIGCALCLKACPVDAIVGAAKHMHTVIGACCTGCELCLPACPVDCIALVGASEARTGWAAWSAAEAALARSRHDARQSRLAPAAAAPATNAAAAALARARGIAAALATKP